MDTIAPMTQPPGVLGGPLPFVGFGGIGHSQLRNVTFQNPDPIGYVPNPNPGYAEECECCCPCKAYYRVEFTDYSSGSVEYCQPGSVTVEVPAPCPDPCGNRTNWVALTADQPIIDPPSYAFAGNVCPTFRTVAPASAMCNDVLYTYAQTKIDIKCGGVVVNTITCTDRSGVCDIAWPSCTAGQTCEIEVLFTYTRCPCVLESRVEFLEPGSPDCEPGSVEYEIPAPCPGLCDDRSTTTAYTQDQPLPEEGLPTYWPQDTCANFVTVAPLEASCQNEGYKYKQTTIEILCAGGPVNTITCTSDDGVCSIAWPPCTLDQSCTIRVTLTYEKCPCVLDARVEFRDDSATPPLCEPGSVVFEGPAPCPDPCTNRAQLTAITDDQAAPSDPPRYFPNENECQTFDTVAPLQAECDGKTYNYVKTTIAILCNGSEVASVECTTPDGLCSIAWPSCTEGQTCQISLKLYYEACPCKLEARVYFHNEMDEDEANWFDCMPGQIDFDAPTPCPGNCDTFSTLTAYTVDQPLPTPLPAYDPLAECDYWILRALPNGVCDAGQGAGDEQYVFDRTEIRVFCGGVEIDGLNTEQLVAILAWPRCEPGQECRIEVDLHYIRRPSCCPDDVQRLYISNIDSKPNWQPDTTVWGCPPNFMNSIWERAFLGQAIHFTQSPCEFEIYPSCEFRIDERRWSCGGGGCGNGTILHENEWDTQCQNEIGDDCPCDMNVKYKTVLSGFIADVCVRKYFDWIEIEVYQVRPLLHQSQFLSPGGDCDPPPVPFEYGRWLCGPGSYYPPAPGEDDCGPELAMPDFYNCYDVCPSGGDPGVATPYPCLVRLPPVSWSWGSRKVITDEEHDLVEPWDPCDAVRWLADNPQVVEHSNPEQGAICVGAAPRVPGEDDCELAGGDPGQLARLARQPEAYGVTPRRSTRFPTATDPGLRAIAAARTARKRPAIDGLVQAAPRTAPPRATISDDRTERYAKRLALCQQCVHFNPSPGFGKMPSCALLTLDKGKPPCQRRHQRLLWTDAGHPDPACLWNRENA